MFSIILETEILEYKGILLQSVIGTNTGWIRFVLNAKHEFRNITTLVSCLGILCQP